MSDPALASAFEHAPPVVATMVVHEPGDWFPETLAALAAQDYPGLQHLFLLSGDPSAAANSPARDLIETALPDAVIRYTGGNPGYAASCNAVLNLVQGDGGFFCFLHDDVALAPDAVSRLVEETYRSNAGVTGPKLVHWDNPRMIQSVGTAVDRLGVGMPLADDGEIDQEQHDIVQDVFVLSSACLLVRADLFRSVGGFHAPLPAASADLDLCWRIHLTGARVVVVPAAVARHREAAADRADVMDDAGDNAADDLTHEHDAARLATVFTLTSRQRLFATALEALAVGLVHALVVLVTGSPRRALDEIRALLSVPLSARAIAARRKSVTRTVTDAEVHALQVRGSAHIVGYLRRRDRRRGVEQAQATAAGAREVAPRSSIVMWSVLVLVLVVGSRSLLLHGPAVVGQFVRLDDGPRSLLRAFASGWWGAGFGQVGSVPTGVGLTAAGGAAALGNMGLLRTLLIVGAPLVGWLGVWRFASVLTTRAARVAATLAYAAVPLAWASIAAGRWGGLVTYALFPWLAHHMRRLVGHVPVLRASDVDEDAFGDLATAEWRRTFLAASLTGAVLLAFEPGNLVTVALLGAVWAPVTLLHGARLQWSVRWAGIPAAVAAAAVVMNLPWAASYARDGWWEAVTGAPVEGGRSLGIGRLATFQVGSYVLGQVAVLLIAPVLGAMLVVRGSRLPWALRGAMLSITGFLVVLLDDKALLPVHLPEPAVMLVPVAFGLAVCAGAMGAGLNIDLRRGRISWRQPLGFLVAAAFTVGLVPGAVNAVAGDWNQPDMSLSRLLAQLPDDDGAGDYRTLFIGDPRVLPAAPANIGWGIAYSVVNGRDADLEDGWETAPTRANENASRAVRGIVRGTTARAGRLLAPLSVRYLVVPIVDGGQSTRSQPLAEPRGLVDALSRQLDLKRRFSSPDLAIFENSTWLPVASLLTPAAAEASRLAGAESMIAADLGGAVPVMPGVTARRSATAVTGPGVLHLAVPYTDRWQVEVSGAGATRGAATSPAFGLTNAVELDGESTVTLSMRTSWLRTLVTLLQISLWAVVVWFSVPRRRRRRRRDTVAQFDAALTMGVPA
ncbi:MAG: glycosyltransferase [Actinomycetota bacterium]